MLTAARPGRRRARGRLLAVAALVTMWAAVVEAVPATPAAADSVRSQQMWVLDAVQAPAAWRITRGQGVLVAVIDSGVNPHVSDLAGSVVTGPDLTGLRTARSNPGWGVHGTWMASLIAGHGHAGGSGILGVAPRAKVLSVRVLADKTDPGYRRLQHEPGNVAQQTLAKAIRYATAHGAQVISMSLGNGAASQVVRLALQHALDRGVVVVASSGNDGDTSAARKRGQAPYSFPADYPGVLGVGALNQAGEPARFSSDNLSVQVSAPGVNVPAQGRDGQYWLVSGTSPACALTAGVAALIKARYPRLSPALVIQAITSTAQNPPSGGYNRRVGAGAVDAAAALSAARRLARYSDVGRGIGVAAHFGGGPAAIPPMPVAPRGKRALELYALMALVSLAVALAALRLLRRNGRAAAGGPPAQQAGYGGWAAPGAATGRAAWAPGPPEPRVPGPPQSWAPGPPQSWAPGPPQSWAPGPPQSWAPGPPQSWAPGPPGPVPPPSWPAVEPPPVLPSYPSWPGGDTR